MTRSVKPILGEEGQFTVRRARAPLPRCHIRAIQNADFNACVAIYRLNEAGQFPPVYAQHFLEWLYGRHASVLVADVDGEVRGFGGHNVHRQPTISIATLTFEMVHPNHHRQGFGTALLLAQIAALAEADHDWYVCISTSSGTETFYRQFGFSSVGPLMYDGGRHFDLHRARLDKDTHRSCGAVLRAASISLDATNVVGPPMASAQFGTA
jgi:GNAT superfamily N-acetyltransferase